MSFSPLSNLYQMISDTQESVSTVQTVESPAAYLTLTRTASQAIVSTGSAITWQTAIRSQGISWSGTTITIPSAGYYHLSVSIALVANTNCYSRLAINGVNAVQTYITAFATGGGFGGTSSFMLYLEESDSLVVGLTPGVNTTLNVNPEGGASPSPILNIVQLSGVL